MRGRTWATAILIAANFTDRTMSRPGGTHLAAGEAAHRPLTLEAL